MDALVVVDIDALELKLVLMEIEVETLKIINNRNIVTQGLITLNIEEPCTSTKKNPCSPS